MLKLENSTFSYYMSGELDTQEPYIHMKRTMKSYELIFVTKGILYMEENGIQYELSQNQMIILEPDKLHRGYKIHEGGTGFYWFHYNADNLPIPFKTYTGKEYHETKALLKKMFHVSKTPTYSETACDALALCIYEELKQISKEGISFKPVVKKITEHIRVNLDKKLTVASIAQKFGYNPDYLSKAFCNATGITLKQYIVDSKLKVAKDYLHSTELSIKQIAYNLGFNDELVFIKFFTYHEMQSPTAFRNKYFNTHILNK